MSTKKLPAPCHDEEGASASTGVGGFRSMIPVMVDGLGRRLSMLITIRNSHVAAILFLLWLMALTPVLAIPEAGYDEGLFVRLAGSLLKGEWLGAYDNLTLAKGPFYPLFLAAGWLLGLPVLVWQGLAYAIGCLVISRGLRPWLGSEAAALTLFLVLLFSPVPFGGEMTRVMREGVYTPLSMLIFGAVIWWFRCRMGRPATRVALAVGLGVALAAFWVTREEGMWIMPALSICLVLALVPVWRGGRRPWRALSKELFLVGIVLVVAQSGVAAVKWMNFRHYGVFDVVEFKQREFLAAYGALSRVEHREWRRYVVVPREVLERVFQVSPAAAETRPYFDGPDKGGFVEIGCQTYGVTPCDGEIRAGWFMWALRDAAAKAGHHRDAAAARDYYGRLAAEIDRACDDGRLACLPARATMAPPFRWEYLTLTLDNAVSMLGFLVNLPTLAILDHPSSCFLENCGERRQYGDFLGMIGTDTFVPMAPAKGPIVAGAADERFAERSGMARGIVEGIATAYRFGLRDVSLVALLAHGGVLAWSLRRKRLHPLSIVATIALILVASRLLLLSYLDVVAIPSRLLLYCSPAFPFLIVFVFSALVGPWAVWKDPVDSRNPSA